MKKGILLFLLGLCICLVSAPDVSAFDGPLRVRNQFPLFIHNNVPHFESASMETSFSADLSYSSVYMVRDSRNWQVGMDMEIAELDLVYKKKIGELVELGIEIPVLSFNSGFMDGFLDSYHSAFGFSDYGRSNRPENDFLYEIRRDGKLVIKGRNGSVGIGDIRLTAKKVILKDDPVVSIKVDVELPTGDADTGYGNGSFDAGLALLAEKELGKNFRAYSTIGFVLPGDLRAEQTIKLREYLYGMAALEANIGKGFSLLGQIYFQGSPYPDTGIPTIDRIASLLTFGARYHTKDAVFDLSLSEDPNTAGAPDFSILLSFRKKF